MRPTDWPRAPPEALTEKVPLAKLALPAGPTAPISRSAQPEGSGPPVTVRASVVVLLKLPEVPVMVTVAVPMMAVLPAVSVKVLVPVVLAGLKAAVTPFRRPQADNLTVPANPFSGVSVIVLVPLAPWAMLRLVGEADRLNCGGGTVIETLSKVAVVRRVLSLLLMAKPMKMFWAMVMVWLEPTGAQLRPSGEA